MKKSVPIKINTGPFKEIERNLRLTNAVKKIKEETPILKYFKISGLNGYKNIAINFETSVKVVASENGAGKTTVMNALYGILTGKSEGISKIDFDHIEIEFRIGELKRFEKKDLVVHGGMAKAITDSKFNDFILEHWNISSADIEDLLNSFEAGSLEDHPLYERIYFESPYDKDDIQKAFERLQACAGEAQVGWKELQSLVKEALGDIEVIYLPTYRRVEVDLPQFRKSSSGRRGRSQRFIKNEIIKNDDLINFGLSDVEEKLSKLLEEIKESTLSAYSQISRNTLQQLAIKNNPEETADVDFEKDEIKVIFARLPEDNSAAESAVLDLIESGAINDSENRNLKNFLSQLVDAFNETRGREVTINKFVTVVNHYLSLGIKEKEFIYDKYNVRVDLKNTIKDSMLKLNNLSSGEKQVVSIFSRMCLDRIRKAVVLIDEPELSLSIDWQKILLPDIWLTGNCAQLIAITHSPFVFENRFDPFAGSMKISYAENKDEDEIHG